ncbi:MAG: alpha/beta hydrolase [Chloroflexi bacterium]|nr:alpha/beta hydrolase [Chloroflexota bacterium]
MKKFLRIFTALLLAIVSITFVAAIVWWTNNAYPPSEIGLEAMRSDSEVFVVPENGWVVFHPAGNPRPEVGFIFYPGANVDYRAYAPVMKLIAIKGYLVAIVPQPLNLAFFNSNAAARVQAAYPEIENWFIGGHSLGGVVASSYAVSHVEIRGLVLWASTPGDDAVILRGTDTISIFGTHDGLFTRKDVDDSRALLPADTVFVPIDGGNHSQFGSYGLQEGDEAATISPEEQWMLVAGATTGFFEEVMK